MNHLLKFLKNSSTIVVERSVLYEPSKLQLENLIIHLSDIFDVSTKIHLDLPNVECEGFPTFSEREIYILERKI